MKPIQIILLAILSLVMINCSKDGEIGPQGLQGEIGPAGKNGSVMHAGDGVPSDTTGVFGDYYLDKLTNQLYGPKTDGIGWGVPIVLKGDTGSAGSQIFAGTTLPSSSLGTVGDFYLNKSTYDLYGPKQESGWGSPLNLKGMPEIIYSAWINADWNLVDNPKSKGMLIPVTQLSNKELRNNSLIVMYLQQYGTSQIYTMPSSGRWGNAWYDYTFGGNTASFTQKIYVKLKSTDLNDLTEFQYAGFRGNRFRYVIVPVGIAASMSQPELMEYLSKKP